MEKLIEYIKKKAEEGDDFNDSFIKAMGVLRGTQTAIRMPSVRSCRYRSCLN